MQPATTPLDPATRQQLDQTLAGLLSAQTGRLRRRYLGHGLGLLLLLPLLALGLSFALDETLRLPAPIRLFHSFVTVALAAFVVVRFLRYPLSRRFAPQDIALAFERSFPELRERLISAIQLRRDGALRNQSAAMIDELLRDTTAAMAQVQPDQMFDGRRTARIWLGAGGAAAVLLTVVLAAPDHAWAFALRHLGLSVSYPKATRLVVELPPDGPDLQRRDHGDRVALVLSAGADLHVSVLAEGRVPDKVALMVTGSGGETRRLEMSPRPGGRFRHVFRRLSGSFTFHATGGDDDTGDRSVEVTTIHPPSVAEIEHVLTSPAYTGRPPRQQRTGAIEGLVGSHVRLQVSTTAAAKAATLVFLEGGTRQELAPIAVSDDSGRTQAFAGEFTILTSDRYQIELIGEGGLRNPNPGSYPVAALQDYAPVGRWLQPEDDSINLLLPEALLCVRVDGRDDFGLSTMLLDIEAPGGRTSQHVLVAPSEPEPAAAQVTEFFEVKDLLGGTRAGSDGLALTVTLRDNREPEAGVTVLPRRSVQIVDATQLAAAIARLFRGLREETEAAMAVQRDRRERLEELLAGEAGPGNPAPGSAALQNLTAAEVGQGRIQGSAERLGRGLSRAFDLHLWNRLETSVHGAKVLELYREQHRSQPELVATSARFYRTLHDQRQAGGIGALDGCLDRVLAMWLLADGLQTELAPAASRLLGEAQVAADAAALRDKVAATIVKQKAIEDVLGRLLARLDEWNDFQDVVQETRALRDRQKDVQSRTEDLKGGDKK